MNRFHNIVQFVGWRIFILYIVILTVYVQVLEFPDQEMLLQQFCVTKHFSLNKINFRTFNQDLFFFVKKDTDILLGNKR